jgi:hypothetical protein
VARQTNPWIVKMTTFLQQRKYELLLLALIQHLFIGVVLTDLAFYARVVWPVNMLVLGVASVGVFVGKAKWKNILRTLLFSLVLALPLMLPFLGRFPYFMQVLCGVYVVFFAFIFWEVMLFLVKPSYINADIIWASACGYLLLLEVSVFLMQLCFYIDPLSFNGVDAAGTATTYIDLVYFCSITLTSIGFGDITPNNHHTKLLTSLLGIAGQFYLVVLVGILISKFTTNATH